MQHPNAEWIRNPIFDSLRRWKPGKWSETSQPVEATLAEINQAGSQLACSVRGMGRRADDQQRRGGALLPRASGSFRHER
jgi:hypothetical protein